MAADCNPLLERENAKTGYKCIADKFTGQDEFGPTSVRKFVEEINILGGRTADQWQTDAFGQVQAWLKELGLV